MAESTRPVLGFDVGATSARGVVYGGRSDIDWSSPAARRKRSTRDIEHVDQLADVLVELTAELRGQVTAAGAHGDDESDASAAAVGVAVAAQLDRGRRVVLNSPNFGWRDAALAEAIEDAWEASNPARPGVSEVSLWNDVDALLWGEHIAGQLIGSQDALAVIVGSGVGGALLCNGELYTGTSNLAGELGHNKVVPGGRRCGCGQHGCVEAYAGGIHLERRINQLVDEGHYDPQTVTDADTAADVQLSSADAQAGRELDAFQSNETGGELGMLGQMWREATDYLAVVVANACTTLNPDSLLVGGGVLSGCPVFRREFLTKVSPLIGATAADTIEIVSPGLGEWAGAAGAAHLGRMESAS